MVVVPPVRVYFEALPALLSGETARTVQRAPRETVE